MNSPDQQARTLPSGLFEGLNHGQEEVYLEYKGDVPWSDQPKRLEIVQTIFALANQRNGGLIVIGVEDDGKRVGLSEDNFNSYHHDQVSQYLSGKGNQPIDCKLDKFVLPEGRFVFIQVNENREFPVVYTGDSKRARDDIPQSEIILRKGALYIRSKNPVSSKEIQTLQEWQEMIERTYRKYERETLRRNAVVAGRDPYEGELSI